MYLYNGAKHTIQDQLVFLKAKEKLLGSSDSFFIVWLRAY